MPNLLRASVDIFQHRGPLALVRRVNLWLRGNRRYSTPDTQATYRMFCRRTEPNNQALRRQKAAASRLAIQPRLSVITALNTHNWPWITETYWSIKNQSYAQWEWLVVIPKFDGELFTFAQKLSAQEPRLRLIASDIEPGQSNPASLLNQALRAIQGEFFVVVEAGDTLAPFAFFSIAERVQKNAAITALYSDMDHLDAAGTRVTPLFRPDWSPALMLSTNLLECLTAYRAELLTTIGFMDPNVAPYWAWEYALRLMVSSDLSPRIEHISQILYHRRLANVPVAKSDAAQKILETYLKQRGFAQPQAHVTVESSGYLTTAVTWAVPKQHLVSIIIPSRDQPAMLEECLNSLFALTDYAAYEVIVVDTGSVEPATQELYQRYEGNSRFRVIAFAGTTFNFSAACNQGVSNSNGGLLLFLNNDTRVLQANWLRELVQWFEDPKVGIVGPKLVYPDGTIQHAGVIVGLAGLAGHLFQAQEEKLRSIFGSDEWYRTLQAVTGACLMISREVFQKVNGFDEGFVLNFSDVDLCLRVHAAGYQVIYTPQVRLIHHEAATHQARIPRADFERADRLWRHWLDVGDPYFNVNLSYRRFTPFLRQDDGDSSSEVNREMMRKLPKQEIVRLARL